MQPDPDQCQRTVAGKMACQIAQLAAIPSHCGIQALASAYPNSPCCLSSGRTMVKVLLFLGGLAILLVSSRQVMFHGGSFRARGNNLLDEFRWARAFRCCRRRVDLLAIAYLMHLL